MDLEKDSIPFRAVVGGTENGKPTYVARVIHNGHHEIAKLNHWKRFGYGYYGKELETPHGEVLVASEMQVKRIVKYTLLGLCFPLSTLSV